MLGHGPHATLVIAAIALLSGPRGAQACSVCGCGDPLVTVGEVAGATGNLGVELDFQYLNQKAGSETPGATDSLNQYSLLLTASYTPVERLNLVLTLPWVFKNMQMLMPDGISMPSSDLNGFGDMQVGARWFFWDASDFRNRTRQALSLNVGTSIPTGSDSATLGGVRVDQHGQIGTGGWGPNAGLFYRLQGDAWSGYAGAWGIYRTQNSYGYRFGEAALWTVAAQYQPAAWFAAALGVDGRWAAADRDSGQTVDNTGGLVVAAAPAVYFNVLKGAWLYAKAQLPFATKLYGAQTINPVITTGLRFEVL